MIQEACRRLRLHPREIVYVGDTVSDMIMARRAGAGLAVAVLGGAADESILAAEADVVISGLTAISVSGEN
jgi:phosphoglycolate phosphatase-like HAD superfamily hydrolase